MIAGRLTGRTDNEIKNYWNTHIKRKLLSRGTDPQTHRPINPAASINFRSSPAAKENTSSSADNTKCSSTTTEESLPPLPEEESGGGGIDLELSIGIPSQPNEYRKSASFNLNSCHDFLRLMDYTVADK